MKTRAEIIEIAQKLGEALSKSGTPFVCIVGVSESETLRMSSGLGDPDNNTIMGLEVNRYLLFIANGGGSRN